MKIFKIILINIILIILVLFLCDYLTYKAVCNEYISKYTPDKVKLYPPPEYKYFYQHEFVNTTIQFLKNHQNDGMFRPVFKEELDYPAKPSILVFGCSFAFGGLLNERQTFSYKLQKQTNRPVYNYGICAGGIQHMLYIIQHPEFLRRVDDIPQYAIYVYIPDHQRRLHADSHPIETNGLYLRYDFKENNLQLKKEYLPSFMYRTFLVRRFLYNLYKKYYDGDYSKQTRYENFILTNEIFLESKNILSERYPGIKFVILKYSDFAPVAEYKYLWDILEKEGFIIIDTKDLVGRKFTVDDTTEDKFHPNEQAWDLIVPKLAEKLNL